MRISKTRSGQMIGSGKKAAPSGDRAAFSSGISAPASGPAVHSAGATQNLSSVAALMALQGTDDATEKKRRAERRGRQLLDGLDRLKMDLLEGKAGAASLSRLKELLESSREETDDQKLESLIDQIELRVEVELAKQESVHR
tara:strand:+ start:137 stop:562 length:426 start_codon:yes stop_codon:yes gene_type:complete